MDNLSAKIGFAIEKILRLVVYRLLKIELSETSWNTLLQFVGFGIVGLTNTLIGFLIYTVTLSCMHSLGACPSCDVYIAQLVMFLLSVLWSFYWNNRLVFAQKDGEKRNIFSALMKAYASYAFTGLFLSELLLLLWVKVLKVNDYVAPVLNLIVTIPLNFIIQKYWTFHREK